MGTFDGSLTVVLVDCSADVEPGRHLGEFSERSPFLAARRIAAAIVDAALASGPVEAIGVGNLARPIPIDSIGDCGMNFFYGANHQHALMLARARSPQRVVIVAYSDPTARLLSPNQELCQCPASDEAIESTRRELRDCARASARMDAVLIVDPARLHHGFGLAELPELIDAVIGPAGGQIVNVATPLAEDTIGEVLRTLDI